MKYNNGDLVGPCNMLLIRRTKRVDKNYYGIFKCPFCGKEFETQISKISGGINKSCGCQQYSNRTINNGRFIDLTGKKFGRLTVLSRNLYVKSKRVHWNCRCDCGNTCVVDANALRSGNTQSCGCLQKERTAIAAAKRTKDFTGQRVGMLTVLSPTNRKRKDGCKYWKCQCDCGNITYVASANLSAKNIFSCGCISSKGEQKIQSILENNNIKFERQKTFHDCINPHTKSKLKFDFYLPEYNLCIEYDGEQHYSEKALKKISHGKGDFQDLAYRDELKDLYCLEHHIKIKRIPYYDFNEIDLEYLGL